MVALLLCFSLDATLGILVTRPQIKVYAVFRLIASFKIQEKIELYLKFL